jgi:hypothetical protein
MTVYNIQDYWNSGLCLSSGILNTKKTTFRKLHMFPSWVKGETPTQLGPLERANGVQWLRLANTVHVSNREATVIDSNKIMNRKY